MKLAISSGFESRGYFLSELPVAEAFSELPDLRDLPKENEGGFALVSASGAGLLVDVGDRARSSIRSTMLMAGRAYGTRSGREKKAKKGHM
jgi:hypothetical protein